MSAAPNPESIRDKIEGTVDTEAYARLNGVDERSIEAEKHVENRGHKKVILVGAGVSGITKAALLLKHKAISLEDLVIFDVQANFGGVWEKNKYPGCACDVPALQYTNKLMINTEYTHYYATRDQIASFYVKMAHDLGLNRCVQFQTFVKSCVWDETRFVWHIEAENQKHRTIEKWTTDVLIHAVGAFDRPKFGRTPGLESFKGSYWHTSRWNDQVDLKGKRVAVIGCGPSAGQVIPEIIDQVSELTVYMRTPPMVLPRKDFQRSEAWMWSMRNLPFFASTVRNAAFVQQWLLGQSVVTRGSYLNKTLTKKAHAFLEEQVQDKALRELLRPDYEFFCKRPLFLDDFYSALTRPHCTVVRESLDQFVPDGIISTDKATGVKHERSFDVIVFATGFNLAQYLQHETIIGRGGVNLQEQWKAHPSAIYGVATANFPNFFFCNGPNANTYSSFHHEMNEVASDYTSRIVKEIFQRSHHGTKFAVMPNAEFEQSYNDEIQNNLGHLVSQNSACNSYHNNADGHNTIVHHRNIWKLWWRLKKIDWNEWDISMAQDIKD
ncbi:hypothetical protein Z517_04135 [Fonsecaea pedrosoi CBS 271.37]|uniref:FAD/NAD(P)-binding domain-containing protein n=1 Tax=Fonsecaea pedrosoi CBS 271.37 TaxID=1442368 RepID=A0A0D2F394_9EURO|nr:uncharacterized protein Z517_04135 [Fonsecaea pedrosoi CBS 271.37]KIW81112.1 hypothetical protein Z517_04135 [Fonsecaea pedrosoi CBS 271.37]